VRAVVFRNPRRTRGLISLAGPRSRPLQGWSRGEEEEEQEQEQEGGGSYRAEGPGGSAVGPGIDYGPVMRLGARMPPSRPASSV